MNRIIVDKSYAEKFGEAQFAEICDETVRLLGYFTPAVDHSLYEGVESPITGEEFDKLVEQGGGRQLKDIIADLEKRA
jgi:hypothetical protein